MNILTHLQQFLNKNLDSFYKSQRESLRDNVRKHYNIPETDTLWFNGFYYKPIIYINARLCFDVYVVPIQRMIWIKEGYGERVHIYLRPSFVLMHCPFSICTLEFIWNAGIPDELELFEVVEDPEELLYALDGYYKKFTEKIDKTLGTSEYMINWSNLYYSTFHSLAPEAIFLDPDLSPSMRTYQLIRLYTERLNMKVSKHEYLSFANFQFPLN